MPRSSAPSDAFALSVSCVWVEMRPAGVAALFGAEVARWVQEAPSFFTVAQEATPDGWLVTLQVREERDVLQWLLGWGRHVRVLEPASLQRLIAEEAEAMWAAHKNAAAQRL